LLCIGTSLIVGRDEINTSKKLQFLVQDDVNEMRRRFESIGEIFLKHVRDSSRWRDDFIQAIRDNASRQNISRGNSSSAIFIPDEEYLEQEKELLQRMLSRLRFYGMRERHERILPAYHKTFEWLYDGLEKSNKPWASFSDWLSNDNKLYWITGKPGAGKSTIMKFLYHDPRTAQQLKIWAAERPLVIAAFFFWNSGGIMQMSQIGLLRSILFDILHQCPQFVSKAFPERWEIFRLFGEDTSPFEEFELRRALNTLVQECSTSKKLCIFVDGLDELEGDHTNLVDLVRGIIDVPNVKVCVSSRPWPVFEESFQNGPSLTLQDLSFPDIQLYVKGKLSENSGFQDLMEENSEYAHTLITEITTKSSGVFLWVRLVVQSLLKGLVDGDRVSDLQKRLYDLPPDLEDLFLKMLDSVEERHREHAAQLFQLHRAACSPPTILLLSFADEEDANFILRLRLGPLTRRELQSRCRRMKRRLMSRCKGFLEIAPAVDAGLPELDALLPSWMAGLKIQGDASDAKNSASKDGQPDTDDNEAYLKVEYLHRTVKDFISQREIWARIVKGTKSDFVAWRRLCSASVAQVKTRPPASLRVDTLWDLATSTIEYAMVAELHTGSPENLLLDELDRSMIALTNMPDKHGRTFLETHADIVSAEVHWTHTRFSWRTPSPFLHLAAMCGLSSYVREKLPHDRALLLCQPHSNSTPLLYSATCSGSFAFYADKPFCARDTPHLETIKMLLDNGCDPNEIYQGNSAWRNLVTLAQTRAISEEQRATWVEVMEIFMQHGAQPPINKDMFMSSSFGSMPLRELDAILKPALQTRKRPPSREGSNQDHGITTMSKSATPSRRRKVLLDAPETLSSSRVSTSSSKSKWKSFISDKLRIGSRSRHAAGASFGSPLIAPTNESHGNENLEGTTEIYGDSLPDEHLIEVADYLVTLPIDDDGDGNMSNPILVTSGDREHRQDLVQATCGSEEDYRQRLMKLDEDCDNEDDANLFQCSDKERTDITKDFWGRKWIYIQGVPRRVE
jgi:hypothetical protein